MIDTLRLTAEEATRLVRDKELSSAELWGAYQAAISERDADEPAVVRVLGEPVRLASR